MARMMYALYAVNAKLSVGEWFAYRQIKWHMLQPSQVQCESRGAHAESERWDNEKFKAKKSKLLLVAGGFAFVDRGYYSWTTFAHSSIVSSLLFSLFCSFQSSSQVAERIISLFSSSILCYLQRLRLWLRLCGLPTIAAAALFLFVQRARILQNVRHKGFWHLFYVWSHNLPGGSLAYK